MIRSIDNLALSRGLIEQRYTINHRVLFPSLAREMEQGIGVLREEPRKYVLERFQIEHKNLDPKPEAQQIVVGNLKELKRGCMSNNVPQWPDTACPTKSS
jgi:hypothetical protein